MKRLFYPVIIAGLALAPVALALAVGTVTVTRVGDKPAQQIEIGWTSDCTTTATAGTVRETIGGLDGYFERVVFIPDTASTTTTPNANYDVTLLDADGFDLLTSVGLNLSASATEHFQFFPATSSAITTGTQLYNVGPVNLEIDNASTSPSVSMGTIRIYLRR